MSPVGSQYLFVLLRSRKREAKHRGGVLRKMESASCLRNDRRGLSGRRAALLHELRVVATRGPGSKH